MQGNHRNRIHSVHTPNMEHGREQYNHEATTNKEILQRRLGDLDIKSDDWYVIGSKDEPLIGAQSCFSIS